LNDCVRIGNVIAEYGDVGPDGDGRPVRQAERDILIIIEDRDFQASIPFEKTFGQIQIQCDRYGHHAGNVPPSIGRPLFDG
jgi:hypothetical protein